jgi:hypothetical protein
MKKMVLVVCAVLCVVSTGFAKVRGQQPNLISCQNDCGTVALHYASSSVRELRMNHLTINPCAAHSAPCHLTGSPFTGGVR